MYNYYLNSYLKTKIIHGQLGFKIKEFKILKINFVNVHQIFFNIIILQISQDHRQSNCLHPVHQLPFATFQLCVITFDDISGLLPVKLPCIFYCTKTCALTFRIEISCNNFRDSTSHSWDNDKKLHFPRFEQIWTQLLSHTLMFPDVINHHS